MTEYLTKEDVLTLISDLGVGPVRDLGLLDSAVHRPSVTLCGAGCDELDGIPARATVGHRAGPVTSASTADQPNSTLASSQRSCGTDLTESIASVSGTSTISVPRSETMRPKPLLCTRSIAAVPRRVDSTRS